MAEVIAVGASVIAIIQIADRIIGFCKFYIETARDAPSDLRLILVETSALKVILENLKFLTACDGPVSAIATHISGADGPIEGCLRAVTELEDLFPADLAQLPGQKSSKRRKLKDVLTALAWPLKESKARKLLDMMMRYKTTISLALTTDSMLDIKHIKDKSVEIHDMLTESQRQGVYQWLHHTDPSPLHHRAQKDYEPETGDWVLRSPEWVEWLARRHRCLWIHGIPGAGKTVLMSHLIEQIRTHCEQTTSRSTVYDYYYCYFAHNQDEAKPFLKWLINNLCRKAEYVPRYTYALYKRGADPSLAELLEAVAQTLTKFDAVYVAVDAIDESSSQDDILQVLMTFVTDTRFEGLRLITSSREHVNIEKVMLGISTPVSMNNPFVEQDIRRYVHSIIQANSRFGRWPGDLLQEVEESVSAGAKGMFRWAVCQIDALQRLKPERDNVQKALKNLPKTLNETYDRIIFAVPQEDRLFVEHAFHWIAHHNELYNGEGIPFKILIQATEASILDVTGNRNDRFYDEDTLRAVCGCLINISSECYGSTRKPSHYSISVKFAHYSVREYLDSTHVFDTISGSRPVDGGLRIRLLRIILSQALEIRLIDTRDVDLNSTGDSGVIQAAASKFTIRCIVSVLRLMFDFSDQICQQSALDPLVIDFLDPSRSHFEHMEVIAIAVDEMLGKSSPRNMVDNLGWAIQRRPNASLELNHLCNLLLLTEKNSGYSRLINTFLLGKDLKNVLEAQLCFERKLWPVCYQDSYGIIKFTFNDPLIEVYAQLSLHSIDAFKLLTEFGAGCFDPSVPLLLSIGGHDHPDNCKDFCYVERLLELGADPNLPCYRVTALQIATVRRDFEGAKSLLEAGALPNNSGNPDGIVWEEGSIMKCFSHLHGASPLWICRHPLDPYNVWTKNRAADRKEIEALLLQHGAKDFLDTSVFDRLDRVTKANSRWLMD